MPPRVTLGVATYERDTYLAEAVASCLRQTYDDLEVLVVLDGGRNPNIERVLAGFDDPRLRVVRHERNRGIAEAYNTIIRTFISLPAGVARMPFWKFTALTLAGCLPWVFALTFAGQKAAENWTSWKDSLHYVDYTVAVLIVLGVVYLAVRWRRNRNRGRAADAPA